MLASNSEKRKRRWAFAVTVWSGASACDAAVIQGGGDDRGGVVAAAPQVFVVRIAQQSWPTSNMQVASEMIIKYRNNPMPKN